MCWQGEIAGYQHGQYIAIDDVQNELKGECHIDKVQVSLGTNKASQVAVFNENLSLLLNKNL